MDSQCPTVSAVDDGATTSSSQTAASCREGILRVRKPARDGVRALLREGLASEIAEEKERQLAPCATLSTSETRLEHIIRSADRRRYTVEPEGGPFCRKNPPLKCSVYCRCLHASHRYMECFSGMTGRAIAIASSETSTLPNFTLQRTACTLDLYPSWLSRIMPLQQIVVTH